MKIFLMRHGEASFDAPHDDVRELTELGRERIRWNVQQKQQELETAVCLLSSPLVRAKQTAELCRQVLQRKDVIQEVPWLIHETRPATAVAALEKLPYTAVLLFSHQPFASRLVEKLCGLDAGAISFNTAGIVAMEVDPVAAGCGNILWQLS